MLDANLLSKSNLRNFLLYILPLYVGILVVGCAGPPPVKEGSEGAFLRLPYVRVLVADNLEEVKIDSDGNFAIEAIGPGGNKVYYSSHMVSIRQERGRLVLQLDRQKIDDIFRELIIIPKGTRYFLKLDKVQYRGMLHLLPRGGGVRVINNVHVDDYLMGVVPSEIGFIGEPEFEAIKAQAVAARTYALAHLGQYLGEPYDLKADVADQLYLGVLSEKDLVSKAVAETRGFVAKYQDELINAYYHSTCGGLTDDIDQVWDKPSAGYLKSVFDGDFCSWSKYSTWEESYTAGQLKLRVEQYLSADRGRDIEIGDITDIEIVSRSPGGRVAGINVYATKGNHMFGRDKIRWVFRRSSNPELILQSARISINKHFDSQGKLESADFVGSGYGHGVGMCQCGAIGRARAGWKFDTILKHYYTGIEIVKLY